LQQTICLAGFGFFNLEFEPPFGSYCEKRRLELYFVVHKWRCVLLSLCPSEEKRDQNLKTWKGIGRKYWSLIKKKNQWIRFILDVINILLKLPLTSVILKARRTKSIRVLQSFDWFWPSIGPPICMNRREIQPVYSHLRFSISLDVLRRSASFLKTFKPERWSASNFSSSYLCIITHIYRPWKWRKWTRKMNCLDFRQFLPHSSKQNVLKPVTKENL